MKLYKEILRKSKPVDKKFSKLSNHELDFVRVLFNVPKFHPRANEISKYVLSPLSIEGLLDTPEFKATRNHKFILDRSVSKQPFVKKFLSKNKIKSIILPSLENRIKTKPFLDGLIKKDFPQSHDLTLITIGGGLLLNIGAYIAERLSANLILFPTTVLAMADSAGGKVRVNFITKNRAYKHFYKSFYEPNAMFLDKRFLYSLPKKQISIGLAEIIKHSLFQSPKLYSLLLQNGLRMFSDKNMLLKAILWTASLKKVCIDIDVEENENGSRRILRGGHDFSDRIEEDLRLNIPHGIAVAIGIIHQLEVEKEHNLLSKAKKLFNKMDIPVTMESYKTWK